MLTPEHVFSEVLINQETVIFIKYSNLVFLSTTITSNNIIKVLIITGKKLKICALKSFKKKEEMQGKHYSSVNKPLRRNY